MQINNRVRQILDSILGFSFKDRKVLTKQMALFLIITIVPISAINYIWFRTSNSILTENAIQNSNQFFKQVNRDIKTSLEEINNISLSIQFDDGIISLLSSEPEDSLTRINTQNTINEKLINIKNPYNQISMISIIGNRMNFSSTTMPILYGLLKDKEWFKELNGSSKNKIFTKVHNADYAAHVNESDGPVFSYLRSITGKQGQRVGVLVIDIKFRILEQLLEEFQDKKTVLFMIYDSSGSQVYSSDPNRSSKWIDNYKSVNDLTVGEEGTLNTVINGKKSIIHYSTVPYTEWKIISIIPWDSLISQSVKVQRITIMIELIVIALILFVTVVLSFYITKPLTNLTSVMKTVENGNLNVKINVSSKDEVGQLGTAFNNMIEQIRNLIKEVKEEQKKKRDAELKALQAQVNPHFLYNTLNTIRWMAVIQNSENISSAIVALIKLLEFSGKKGTQFVSISDEIEHVKNYIYLQKIRYNDKFTVEYNIDQSQLEYKTIKFILQPIVENSIFHGIEPKEGKGIIKVTLKKVDNKLLFQICDDGVGMCIEDSDTKRGFSGLGISIVNERLVRNFGEQSALRIDSKVGSGTRVEFYLPFITGAEVKQEYP